MKTHISKALCFFVMLVCPYLHAIHEFPETAFLNKQGNVLLITFQPSNGLHSVKKGTAPSVVTTYDSAIASLLCQQDSLATSADAALPFYKNITWPTLFSYAEQLSDIEIDPLSLKPNFSVDKNDRLFGVEGDVSFRFSKINKLVNFHKKHDPDCFSVVFTQKPTVTPAYQINIGILKRQVHAFLLSRGDEILAAYDTQELREHVSKIQTPPKEKAESTSSEDKPTTAIKTKRKNQHRHYQGEW